MTTTPMGAATVRGVIGAVCTFGLTTLGTYQQVSDWEDASVAGGIAFFTFLIVRVLGEGGYDQKRDQPPPQPVPGDVGRRP